MKRLSAAEIPLTSDRANELLRFDEAIGALYWRVRPLRHGHEHQDKVLNTRYAGKIAGWRDQGACRIGIDGKKYQIHRVIWFLLYQEWPTLDLDHRNGSPDNNTSANLRQATAGQNIANARIRSDNSSGYKGVSFDKRDGRWCSYINVNGKRHSLGRYSTADEAGAVRSRRLAVFHGEFARER